MSRKRLIFLILQPLVAAALIYAVSRQVSFNDMVDALGRARPIWLGVGFLCFVLGVLFGALRLQAVLQKFDLRISLGRALMTNGYGVCYSFFLPGQSSGDVAKAFHLGVGRDRIPEVMAGIFFDKAFGVLPLLFLGALSSWQISALDVRLRVMFIALIPIAILGMLFLFRFPLPARIQTPRMLSLQAQFRTFLSDAKRTCGIFGYAVLTQLFVACSVAAFASAFEISASVASAAVAAYAVSSVLALIPITVAGIGVREGAFAAILGMAHQPIGVAILISELLLFEMAVFGIGTWLVGFFHRAVPFSGERRESVWTPRRIRLGLAALLASVIVLPMLAFPLFEPGYRGIYMSAASDEEHYVSIVREVSEGKIFHRNAYLLEEKTGPVSVSQWGDVPIGAIFRFWPWSVGSFVVFMKWIGVFVTGYLLLLFLERTTPSVSVPWRVSAVAGFFVLPAFLGPDMPLRLWNALRGLGPWSEFLSAIRFTNPVMTSAVWALSFVTLEKMFRDESRWKAVIAHGCVLGLLAWLYVYFWMFSIVATGLACLAVLARRHWRKAAMICASIVMSTLIAAPHFFFLFRGMASDTGRISLSVATHSPIFEKSVLAVVAIFIAWQVLGVLRKKAWPSLGSQLLTILALTSILAVNQQVITGLSVQPHHFYFITDLPIAGMLLVLFAGFLLTSIANRYAVLIGVVVFGVLLWMGAGVQATTMRYMWSEYADRQRFAPAFEEIQKRKMPLVVLSNNRASEMIPVYTSADVFYAHHAAAYPSTTQERRIYAWYVLSWLDGVRSVGDAKVYFETHRDWMGIMIFEGQYYRELCGSYGCFPDEDFEKIVSGYAEFLALKPKEMFERYRIDAVLWDERTEPQWHLDQYPFLLREWSGEGVSLWNVRL